jgi:hypothetical protein
LGALPFSVQTKKKDATHMMSAHKLHDKISLWFLSVLFYLPERSLNSELAIGASGKDRDTIQVVCTIGKYNIRGGLSADY